MDNLKKALENAMQKDFARYENLAEHEFSARFESEMSKLSERSGYSGKTVKKRPKLRIVKVFAAAAAAVALFSVGTLAGAVSSGFNVTGSKRLGLPAKLFTAADTENCPTTIETVYMLDGFPMNQFSISDCYDISDKNHDFVIGVSSMYFPAPFKYDDISGEYSMPWDDELYLAKVLFLSQNTKETFKFESTDMDYVNYKTLTVNGGQAYFVTRERYYGTDSYLFWESEDYIFTLSGCLSEETAVKLADSLVVYDGEMPFSGLRGV